MLKEEQYRQYRKEINPGFLFLACRYEADDAEFLRANGITHVLNVAQECEPAPATLSACKVLHIPLRDSPYTDILQCFDDAFAFLNSAKRSKGRVLVHCFEGRNRSAAFVIGYKMSVERLTMREAFSQVKTVRTLVDPNVGYIKQLRDFEFSLQGLAVPSQPLSEEECCLLMDLELISPCNLAHYTTLPTVTYEGATLEVVQQVSIDGASTTGAPSKSASLASPKASALVPARGKAATKAAPSRSSPSRSSPRRGSGAGKTHTAAQGSQSLVAHRAAKSTVRTSSPAKAHVKASSKTNSDQISLQPKAHAAVKAPRNAQQPVKALPLPEPSRASGPVPEALALLFDALDVDTQNKLSPAQMSEAEGLLAPLVKAKVASPVRAAGTSQVCASPALAATTATGSSMTKVLDIFRHFDVNGDGMISRGELKTLLKVLEPKTFNERQVTELLNAALGGAPSRGDTRMGICYEQFLRWIVEGTDECATALNVANVSSLGVTVSPAGFESWAVDLLRVCVGDEAETAVYDQILQDEQLAFEIEALARRRTPPFYPLCCTESERKVLSDVLGSRLFLTSWRGAYDDEALSASGISHIASIGEEFEEEPPGKSVAAKTICVVVTDDEDQDEVMQESLSKAVDFLDAAIGGGGRVLVHCAAGISRSTTVVLAYLVARRGFSLREAFYMTRRSRPMIWPNCGFMKVLIRWEQTHRSKATMRLSQYALWTSHDPAAYAAARTVDRDPEGAVQIPSNERDEGELDGECMDVHK
eukprot:TRINITY_DN62476_c0_g1_i1.p1 TRINITY_DN62476_c0_g1~~TRINITY_DN62476_c0_g1_i1.p1  ORF type:complete len:761 (+),score=102.41 TRINITY_DN62476_c0_g1_i1:61-2343(+)